MNNTSLTNSPPAKSAAVLPLIVELTISTDAVAEDPVSCNPPVFPGTALLLVIALSGDGGGLPFDHPSSTVPVCGHVAVDDHAVECHRGVEDLKATVRRRAIPLDRPFP